MKSLCQTKVIAAALLLAVITRVTIGYGAQYPFSDGGLWYVVAESILGAKFTLPLYITFNGELVPYCYPPLAGYMLAVLNALFSLPVLTSITFAPFILNIVAVFCFALFASTAITENRARCAAIIFFHLAIQSYAIFLGGGGVSRNLGLIFHLLTWWLAFHPSAGKSKRSCCAIGALNGLAILSHPTAGFWSTLGIVILWAIEKRLTFRAALAIGAVSALTISPWIFPVLSTHGIVPFLRAFKSSGDEMFSWKLFAAPDKFILPAQSLRALALLGFLVLVATRSLFAPVLFLIALAIDHRGLFVLNGVVIGALAAGYGYSAVRAILEHGKDARFCRSASALFGGLLGMHLLFSNYVFIEQYHGEKLRPTAADAHSYYGASQLLPEGAKVLYLRSNTNEPETGEWFSVFSLRQVRPLPQGQEWAGKYGSEIDALNAISRCCDQGSWECARGAARQYSLTFDAVAVHRPTCSAITQQLGTIIPSANAGNLDIFLGINN